MKTEINKENLKKIGIDILDGAEDKLYCHDIWNLFLTIRNGKYFMVLFEDNEEDESLPIEIQIEVSTIERIEEELFRLDRDFGQPGVIITFTKKRLSFNYPQEDQIDIYDIIKGLSYKPHFNGQTPRFFSIAQHSLLTMELLPKTATKEEKIAALLHDATEAYMQDLPKPLKNLLPEYVQFEKKLQKVIFKKFNLDIELMKKIKLYDIEAQKIEYDLFYGNENVKNGDFVYLDPEQAFQVFSEKIFEMLD